MSTVLINRWDLRCDVCGWSMPNVPMGDNFGAWDAKLLALVRHRQYQPDCTGSHVGVEATRCLNTSPTN